MSLQVLENNGKITVENGKNADGTVNVLEFGSREQADQYIGNIGNNAATRLLIRSAEVDGKKNREHNFGLGLLKRVCEGLREEWTIEGKKPKASDLVPSVLDEIADSVTDEDIMAYAQYACELRAARETLKGKFQAPMKGGKLPRNIAEKFTGLLLSPSASARKAEIVADMYSAL